MFLAALLSLAASERVGSFIVLGDWGYAGWGLPGNGGCPGWACCESYKDCGMKPTCQQTIGDKMKQWVKDNPDVKFVLNVGDSFYPNGISSPTDERWDVSWKNIYGPEVTKLRWYSVYGNHDYEGKDYCACADPANNSRGPSVCAQLNGFNGEFHDNLDGWYMPQNYYYDDEYLSDLGIEVIGLDTNIVAESRCQYNPPGCSSGSCYANLNGRYSASMDLFAQRMKATQADNVLVFNHYPTNYFGGSRYGFIDALKQGPANNGQLYFFGGHTHFVQEGYGEFSISPSKQWLVGGGGGWGCDSPAQGFAVGIISKDANGRFSIEMESQLVSPESCCYKKRYEEANSAVVRAQADFESVMKNAKESCGGLQCKERETVFREVRGQERLMGLSTENTLVKEQLAEAAGARDEDFEFSPFFKETIEEIKKMKAAHASSHHQVEIE